MKEFLGDDFLLSTNTSQQLYFDYAEALPIYDFHCHLSPKDMAENRVFSSITEAWLEGDHYKWRAMRAAGVSEEFITGAASDENKFKAWAETVPQTLRNPLYHWTHLELQRYFEINQLLNKNSASAIYAECNEQLINLPVRTMLKDKRVELVCTVDDPIDNLEHHIRLSAEQSDVAVSMTFRPDAVLRIDEPEFFSEYISELEKISGLVIRNFDHLLEALNSRVSYFHTNGCRLADHGLEHLPAASYTLEQLNGAMKSAFQGKVITNEDALSFRSAVMYELAKMYHQVGWAQLFHLGAIRNTNTRLRQSLGADCGTDSIGDFSHARSMQRFFDRLDRDDQLAKTVVFNLNPSDNEVFATMMGNYNDGSTAGKMQFGSGWWFLDQKDGMQKQMNTLSNLGLLSRFVGMVTDSRSFLSFPRHEYFRRILCDLIGRDVENGELPDDMGLLGKMVQDICYSNAKNFFALGTPQ